jgi:hypothetical protein
LLSAPSLVDSHTSCFWLLKATTNPFPIQKISMHVQIPTLYNNLFSKQKLIENTIVGQANDKHTNSMTGFQR